MALLNIIIFMTINCMCGIIVMIAHEYPKKLAAYLLVHPIYRTKKLFDIPLRKYIDPIGLILFTLSLNSVYGIGWQKPYEYNPSRFKAKEKALVYIGLMGQLSSLLFMFMMIPFFDYFASTMRNIYVNHFFLSLITFNFTIFFINLLPIPPFDMAKMIYAFSPTTYFKMVQNQRIFHLVFVLLVAMGIIQFLVYSSLYPILQVML